MWIYGCGAFGRETLDACIAADMAVDGFLDDTRAGETWEGLPIRLADDVAPAHFVVAIGDPSARARIHRRMRDDGWQAATVVDPRSVIGSRTDVGSGSIVLATAFVSCDVVLGEGSHVNYEASVGHDTTLGPFVTVLPGATVGGEVAIAEGVLVGSNATVLPRLDVGAHSIVGAGAVVTRDVDEAVTVVGTPARPRP